MGKLRAGTKEAIGKTSSWQRWLALHLRAATSELPPVHKNSQDGKWGQRRRVLGWRQICGI